MIPIEKISSSTVATLMLYISILGLLLVVASIIRLKVSWLRRAFIPASLLAGIMGMILGPHILNVIPADMMATVGTLPGQLITVVFACMLLGVKRTDSGKSLFHDTVSGLGWLWSCSFMQVGVACLLCAFIFVPLFDINPLFGSLFEIGFAGGHGTAGGMSAVFIEAFNWPDGADLGMTTATIGLLSGIFFGMIIINYGVRKKYTKVLTEVVSSNDQVEILTDENKEASSYATINQDVVEPFAFHLGIIGISILIGRLIVWGFSEITGYSGLPLFPFAMIGGWIINTIIQRTKYAVLLDRATFQRIQGMALEIVIVSAMASIKIPVVLEYWAPLLIGSVVILLLMLVWVFWLSPRVFNDCWFEQAIIRYGAFTGVAAVGYMLLRTADPKMETDAGTIYALGGPLMSPFIGGGLVTTAYPYIIDKFGVFNTGLIFIGLMLAVLLVLRMFFWNKNFKMEQQ
ncbi:sodium/glutamate symporter superfamily [Peptoniphilus sp. ING2-D1G]|nr:sodium/glutamate symporter superfamily [Peptoniphilus sp. ING2-D1G]